MAIHMPALATGDRFGLTRGDSAAARFVVPLGRVLLALIFIVSAPHLISGAATAPAQHHGVPLASLAVPLAGVLALVGGLSVALGFHARIGAWLLVVFLLPVTLFMHAFWSESIPANMQMQQIEFLKNMALLGASLIVAYFGAGPLSADAWRRRI
jgi:putative oxidoreductase